MARRLGLAGLAGLASANMMDVIETYKVSPAGCVHGCAAWSTKGASLWAHGVVPAAAGSHCAQPGAAVDQYIDGAWCYCKTTPTPAPTPGPTPAPRPHPLDKQVLALYDSTPGMDNFVGIATVAHPTGEPAGSTARTWLRSLATGAQGALPLRFEAVSGQDGRYRLFGQFSDSDYDHYLSVDNTNSGYVSMGATESDAMVVQVVEVEPQSITKAKQFVLINQSPGAAQGLYVSYVRVGQAWIRANSTDLADAMIVELRPVGPVPSTDWGYCTSAAGVPEQINVQIAGPHTVVVAFVTFEPAPPTNPPIVRVGRAAQSLNDTVTGVTHVHVTRAKDRTYYMHFVKLDGLAPRARYHYSVQSGGHNTTVSNTFSFRAPYPSTGGGNTVVDVWGDMGVYSWNNMENLKRDVDTEEVDLVIHLGDLACTPAPPPPRARCCPPPLAHPPCTLHRCPT